MTTIINQEDDLKHIRSRIEEGGEWVVIVEFGEEIRTLHRRSNKAIAVFDDKEEALATSILVFADPRVEDAYPGHVRINDNGAITLSNQRPQ